MHTPTVSSASIELKTYIRTHVLVDNSWRLANGLVTTSPLLCSVYGQLKAAWLVKLFSSCVFPPQLRSTAQILVGKCRAVGHFRPP